MVTETALRSNDDQDRFRIGVMLEHRADELRLFGLFVRNEPKSVSGESSSRASKEVSD